MTESMVGDASSPTRWAVTPRRARRGLLARVLKGYNCGTVDEGIRSVLSHLKAEAERRAAAP
jgi:hypothetical protein